MPEPSTLYAIDEAPENNSHVAPGVWYVCFHASHLGKIRKRMMHVPDEINSHMFDILTLHTVARG